MAELNFKQATDMRTQDIIEDGINSRKISQATKRREKLVKQLKEACDYDAGIAHAVLSRVGIAMDDGVNVNYEMVQKGQTERAWRF